ncbi:MAG: hypothetical protein IT436_05230 [Phycisphaerales bacterium]|nr:hypothetical protein [Phycisphaerales bacterium]
MRTINVTAVDDGADVYIPSGSIAYVRRHGAAASSIRLMGGEILTVKEPPEEIVEQLPDPLGKASGAKADTGKVKATAKK